MATTTIDAEEIGKFFTSIFGLDVKLTDSTSDAPASGAYATYVDGDGNEKGHIFCDLAGASILGAALTQIPMGAVEDAVETGEITDSLRENFDEVMNIAVNVFAGKVSGRLSLGSIETEGTPDLSKGSTFQLSVQRYGDGQINIWMDA